MNSEKRYSAKEVAKIISSNTGFSISERTVNYYAFEKKLFDIEKAGKKIFTDREIEKIVAILILKKYTNFTLNQIKTIINNFTLKEIEDRFKIVNIYKNVSDFYCSNISSYNSVLNSSFCNRAADFENKTINNSTNFKQKEQIINSDKKNIKINEDITLIVSKNIDTKELTKIIEIFKLLKYIDTIKISDQRSD